MVGPRRGCRTWRIARCSATPRGKARFAPWTALLACRIGTAVGRARALPRNKSRLVTCLSEPGLDPKGPAHIRARSPLGPASPARLTNTGRKFRGRRAHRRLWSARRSLWRFHQQPGAPLLRRQQADGGRLRHPGGRQGLSVPPVQHDRDRRHGRRGPGLLLPRPDRGRRLRSRGPARRRRLHRDEHLGARQRPNRRAAGPASSAADRGVPSGRGDRPARRRSGSSRHLRLLLRPGRRPGPRP